MASAGSWAVVNRSTSAPKSWIESRFSRLSLISSPVSTFSFSFTFDDLEIAVRDTSPRRREKWQAALAGGAGWTAT